MSATAPQRFKSVKLPLSELEVVARAIRSFVMSSNKHVGGGLSSAELFATLYFGGVARVGVHLATDTGRDKIILSKGHASASLMFCLWLHGYFGPLRLDDLLRYGEIGSELPRMPRYNPAIGLEMSTGALGQGLSFGNGLAVADRAMQRDSRTFVVLGDAECAEGQVWEAAQTASRLGLKNVIAVIDANGYGSAVAMEREQWAPKWKAFGWDVQEVDGHDLVALQGALTPDSAVRPTALVLRTTKGRGLAPEVEGTNQVGNMVKPEHLPVYDFESAIEEARRIVSSHLGPAETFSAEGETRTKSPLLSLDEIPSSEVGAVVPAKPFISELTDLVPAGHQILFMSPDAVRNSGLSGLLRRDGSWSWDNPSSVVAELEIAEQDAASFAGGLAAGGIHSAVFLMEGFVWRMLDSIRESIAFPGLPVVIVGTSGGLSDVLGPMVQSDACFAAVSSIIGLDCLEASDANVAKVLFAEALAGGRPAYLRVPHEATPVRASLDAVRGRQTDTGCWIAESPKDAHLTIVTAGSLLSRCVEVARQLNEEYGISAAVVEVFGITRARRLSTRELDQYIPTSRPAISVHNAPPSVLGSLLPRGAVSLGLVDYGIAGAPVSALYDASGLSTANIVSAALSATGHPAA